MKRFYLLLAACSALLFSCSTKTDKNLSSVLNPENLRLQIFGINIHRDTTLLTKSGCIIRIPKESLESDSGDVKLEIKEAVNNSDIVLGGLTTMSGGSPLSSGGMIYINPVSGYKVTIKKSLEVLIPTKNYNPGMSVFKGEDSAGKINWKDPEPLPQDSTLLSIKAGERIFKANCANCHTVTTDFTGPALAGVTKRRKLSWLYNFIHNPAEMTGRDRQAKELYNKFKPTVMTAFPLLDHEAINDILAYIETTKSKNWKAPAGFLNNDSTFNANMLCRDSCERYTRALEELQDEKSAIPDTEDFFTLDRTIALPPQKAGDMLPGNSGGIPVSPAPGPVKDEVVPAFEKATFYTVHIETFGWENIDCLLEKLSECTPSDLFVNLNTTVNTDFTVALIAPSVKAFMEGGKLSNGRQYGFDETNGKVSLPQNALCYVIAFAEVNGKIIFGKAEFIAQPKQTININFAETTKQGLEDRIRALRLDGVSAEVKDAKNSEKIKIIEKRSSEMEKLKPVNCECGIPAAPSDSQTDYYNASYENILAEGDSLSEQPYL